MWKLNNQYCHLLLLWFLITCLFVSYLFPIAYVALHSDYFVYINGADEHNYLSYHMPFTSWYRPGYILGAGVVYLLHELGISGAIQNVILDILCPLSCLILFQKCFRNLRIGSFRSWMFAALIIFMPAAFIRTEPWAILANVWPIFKIPSYGLLPILRSPNPQLSYLLAALSCFFFSKKKHIGCFFVFLPLMYHSSAMFFGIDPPP